MIKVNLIARSFCLESVTTSCSCGGRWSRKVHPSNQFTVPVCQFCGAAPESYRMKKQLGGNRHYFTITRRGHRITPDNALELSKSLDAEALAGEFDIRNYRQNNKRTINKLFSTVSEYIQDKFLRLPCLTLAEKEFLEDYMAPYFTEVGSFVFNEVHLKDFLRTFNFRDERKDMAVNLFQRMKEDLSVAA